MEVLVKVSWIVLVIIHAPPALVVFRPAMIESLYGVELQSEMFALMWHRAALFLGIVVLSLFAVADPGVRRVASCCVGSSIVSFLLMYWHVGAPENLRPIAIADGVALVPLIFVLINAWSS